MLILPLHSCKVTLMAMLRRATLLMLRKPLQRWQNACCPSKIAYLRCKHKCNKCKSKCNSLCSFSSRKHNRRPRRQNRHNILHSKHLRPLHNLLCNLPLPRNNLPFNNMYYHLCHCSTLLHSRLQAIVDSLLTLCFLLVSICMRREFDPIAH